MVVQTRLKDYSYLMGNIQCFWMHTDYQIHLLEEFYYLLSKNQAMHYR